MHLLTLQKSFVSTAYGTNLLVSTVTVSPCHNLVGFSLAIVVLSRQRAWAVGVG